MSDFRPEAGVIYEIVSKLNGNVMDIQGANINPDTPIISFPRNGIANQHWIFHPVDDNFYEIVSELNGNVMDIQGANINPGTPIISFPRNGVANQHWTFRPISL